MKSLIALVLCLLFAGNAFAASDNGLVTALSKKTNVSEEVAQKQVDEMFSLLKTELKDGRAVTVRNFGRFYAQDRKARVGRNPKTGAKIDIPARRYPRFASSDNFKKEMNP